MKESGSARAGSENVLARLSELMFVEAIRRYLETLPPAQTGWLAGLRDPVVGQALAALHGEPARAVDGRTAGAARRPLAFGLRRAIHRHGRPAADAVPGVVAHAARLALLVEGGHVAAVAGAVGYESEAAFSRAFKKLVGQAPATWRRGSVPAAAVSAPASASASSVVAPRPPPPRSRIRLA